MGKSPFLELLLSQLDTKKEQASVSLMFYLLLKSVATVNLQRSPLCVEPLLSHSQRKATRAPQGTRQSICTWCLSPASGVYEIQVSEVNTHE